MSNLPQLTDALLTLEDRVAVLTLNRHDLRNALTGSNLIDDLVATVGPRGLLITVTNATHESAARLEETYRIRL